MATQQAYEKEIQALRDDFSALKQDISDLTTAVRADVKASANGAALTAEEKINQAKGAVKEKSLQAVDAGSAGVDAVQAKIEERPIATALTAFGIGLLIGKAINK